MQLIIHRAQVLQCGITRIVSSRATTSSAALHDSGSNEKIPMCIPQTCSADLGNFIDDDLTPSFLSINSEVSVWTMHHLRKNQDRNFSSHRKTTCLNPVSLRLSRGSPGHRGFPAGAARQFVERLALLKGTLSKSTKSARSRGASRAHAMARGVFPKPTGPGGMGSGG